MCTCGQLRKRCEGLTVMLGPVPVVIVLLSGALSENVTVEIGKDVTLTCRGLPNAVVELVVWSRPDLPKDEYVFFFRDNLVAGKHFQETYYGRVMLKDPEMKGGDASVVLKNVTLNDTGTYHCLLKQGGGRRRRRNAPDTFSIIKLRVTNPGHTEPRTGMEGSEEVGDKDGGGSHMIPALSVIGAVVLMGAAVIGFVMYRCSRGSGVQHDRAGLESAEMEVFRPADSPDSE